MDIQILRDGQQTGPFTEEAVQAMLKEGSVLVSDLAWRPGLSEWQPLVNVLYPAATRPPAPPPPPPVVETPAPEATPREPATARQKAFLDYLGIAYAAEISKDDASFLVSDAMEHPKDPARVARWNEERLHLHPELFAAEIQARKENRPQRYLELCQEQGAAFFEKVTKAHCQVLVAHLDVHVPNWDAYEREAVEKHFFPALAEKFPQLVTEQGRAKFKAADKAAGAARPKSTPSVVKTPPSSSDSRIGKVLYAMARGVFLGVLILGLLWIGRGAMAGKTKPIKKITPKADEPAATEPTQVPAPAAPAPAAEAKPEPAPAAEKPVEPAAEKPVEKAMEKPDEKPPEKPAEKPTDAAPEKPAPAAPEKPAEAAALPPPTADPAAPEAKPEAAKSDLPAMSATPADPAASLIPPSPARTSVILTKPVSISLEFGKISIPAGTTVKILAQNGGKLTVRYLEHDVTIPATSTDLGTDPTTPAQ